MNREIKVRVLLEDKWYCFTIGQSMTEYQRAVYDQCCLLGLRFYLFSGLKDIVSRDMYEGDLVEIYHFGKKHMVEIIFHEGMFCFKWKDGYINAYQISPNSCEVIGNISGILMEKCKK